MHSFVADAVANGAKILAGGKNPAEPARGFYYLPTLLDGVDAKSRAVSEEIFGPVLTVERFDDEEQAIASANAHALRPRRLCLDLERRSRAASR